IVDEDVVEPIREIEQLGIRLQECEVRVARLCDGNERLADLDADAVGRRHRVEKVPGLASDVQNALAWLDDEPQETANAVVVVAVPIDPALPHRSEPRLMSTPRLAALGERVRLAFGRGSPNDERVSNLSRRCRHLVILGTQRTSVSRLLPPGRAFRPGPTRAL